MKTLQTSVKILGFILILVGGIVILSSSPTLFTNYALQYVGQNKMNGILSPQQFLLFSGIGFLAIGTGLIIKSGFK